MKRLLPTCPLRGARLALLWVLLLATTAFACQVPVFRYALERWPADRYEILILHAHALDTPQQARLEQLRAASDTSTVAANFEVHTIDVSKLQDEPLLRLWKEHQQQEQPLMIVLYPRNAREVPNRVAHVDQFSEQAVQHLVTSPVRQQLAKKLLDGESAVWIFVPSGHAEQDATALQTLRQQIQRNQEQLELPPQEAIEADELFQPQIKIELRVGFSIVTLDRQDPREQLLLNLLLRSESDLEELDQPLAFPVLGRGRVLYALVGKGIMPETIRMASQFVVGPCSCQVKEQNPGFDLLLGVNWDKEIGAAISKPLPEISSEPVLLRIPPGK